MHIALKWVIFVVAAALVFWFSKYGFAPYAKLHEGHPTLDGKSFYKPSQVRGLLDDLGDFRPKYLEQEQTIDLIFPFVYGLMFVVAIIGLTPGARTPWWLAILPIVAVAGDYIENFTVMTLLKRYPGDLGVLPWLASVASGIKGAGLLASIAAVITLAIIWVGRRLG
jgi:hypothetical protein